MSKNYHFTELDSREFELLCRDLLQRHLSNEIKPNFLFNSFPAGPDGGIDAEYKDETLFIVLQCKRYKKFKDLYRTLKNVELDKVKKLNCTRYILVTSLSLTKGEIDSLYGLFAGYIKSTSDIIGADMLNNLLSLYPDIELQYPRLYIRSMDILSHLLHAGINNRSNNKLKSFLEDLDVYVTPPTYSQAIQILKENHFVIISGDPGIGKTTLAKILSLYFFQEHKFKFTYITSSIKEAWDTYQPGEKQLFFFDDFLGSTRLGHLDRNEDRDIIDFIEEVRKSKDKLLIITTREYILKEAESQYSKLQGFDFAKSIIRQDKFTKSFKIEILHKYLYRRGVEASDIESLIYNKRFEEIVRHKHFTPRLISEFIKRHYNRSRRGFLFYYDLKDYLDNPYSFWEKVFKDLSPGSQTLLSIMVISEEPTLENIIYGSFKNAGKYRELYKKGFEKETFEDSLKELSDSFISISNNPKTRQGEEQFYERDNPSFRDSRFLEFQNPSIKDFTLEYLRTNEAMIEVLIKSAVAFNQLFFVFTPKEEDIHIDDYESEYSLTGKKIRLSIPLQTELQKKITIHFDILPVCRVEKISWHDDIVSYHIDEDIYNNRMEKLFVLCNNFSLQYNQSIKEFVLQKYLATIKDDRLYYELKDEEKLDTHITPLSLEERMLKVDIIHKLIPFHSFDAHFEIQNFFENIRFFKEFTMFDALGKLFPEEYSKFLSRNKKVLRDKMHIIIIDDVDYFLSEGTLKCERALDELIDMYAEDTFALFGFKLTKKLKQEINNIADEDLFRIGPKKQNPYPKSERRKEIIEDIDEMVEEFLYESDKSAFETMIPSFRDFEDTEELLNYLSKEVSDKTLINDLMVKIEDSNSGFFDQFIENTNQIDLLIQHITSNNNAFRLIEPTYKSLIDSICDNAKSKSEIDSLAYHITMFNMSVIGNDTIFRRETVEHLVALDKLKYTEADIDRILENPLIIKRDVWYKFVNGEAQNYLAALHISKLSDFERAKLYRNFADTDSDAFHTYSKLWANLLELDKDTFEKNILIPAFENEYNSFCSKKGKELLIHFLKREQYEFEYTYNQVEGEFFLLSSSSQGNYLVEELLTVFDWNFTYPHFEIAESMNVSIDPSGPLSDYILKSYVNKYNNYTIIVNKEMDNQFFIPLMSSSGIEERIVAYVNSLEKLIKELKGI